MKVSRLKLNIEDLYISKPLEKETFLKVLSEKNANVIHSLYLLANELKSLHYFLSLDDHPEFTVTAYVSIQHGYTGKARSQINSMKCMETRRKSRPMYTITYKLIKKINQSEEFSFKHMTTNKNQIYNLISFFHKKTNDLCKVNTY